MSIEFIYGPASSPAQKVLAQKAIDWLKADAKHQVFYLVPNHVKFETEVSVLENIQQLEGREMIASTRLQVFSFSRLAWYFLQNTPIYSKKTLSESGRHMLLRQLLKQYKDQLTLFKGEVNKAGFIEQLDNLFLELQQSTIDPNDLQIDSQEIQTINRQFEDFQMKLSDIQLLYQAYMEKCEEKALKSNQMLLELAHFLVTQDLQNICFIIDNYSFFTPQELELIDVLVTQSGSFKIHLLMDTPTYPNVVSTNQFFSDAQKLYQHIYHLARENNKKILTDCVLETGEMAEDLVVLGYEWSKSSASPKSLSAQSSQHLQIWQAPNPYTEVSHISKEIRRLVVQEGYRYRDIQVLSRELVDYLRIIEPIFAEQEIPYTLHLDHVFLSHPLIEWVQSLFLMNKRYYRYTDIMRFLRTELFYPTESMAYDFWLEDRIRYRNQIDLTENVVLAYGYEGTYWTRKEDWEYIQYDFQEDVLEEEQTKKLQKESNEIRHLIQQHVYSFFKKMKKAKTGREGATLFYEFLQSSGVEQQLLFWRESAIEQGNLEEAKVHEQTWQALINLLDEYVFIFGEDEFFLEDFEEILLGGMENLSYGQIPTTLDQVNIAPMDLLHANLSKVTFILGLTNQVLPAKIENKTLLTDEDRHHLTQILPEEKELLENTPKKLTRERYRAYLAFQSAQDKLYLTYPHTNERVKNSRISPYVASIQDRFQLPIQKKDLEILLTDNLQESLLFIGTYRNLVTLMINLKRQHKETNIPIPLFWTELEKKLKKQTLLSDILEKVNLSLTTQNIPEKMSTEKVEQLVGNTIFTSVSRIESFYQCQYKYFLTYGLKLKERSIFEFSPAAAGDFYHETLDYLLKLIIRKNLHLSELSTSELNELTEEVLAQVFSEKKFSILTVSNRMHYIRYQLSQTLKRVSWALKEQSRRTGMTTVQTEVLFGQIAGEQALGSLQLDLESNKKMEVRGKIDRLDQITIQDEEYLAVIDYKSSPHKFDFRDAYYGLSMQMITYLDVALQNAVALIGKQANAAGAFYLHVQNPFLTEKIADDVEYNNKMLKEFRYKGLLLEDHQLLSKLDPTISAKEDSLVFPFKLSAKEEFKSTGLIQQEELQKVIAHNRQLFQHAGNQIYSGEVCLNPAFRDKERVACKFCSFRSICQFDVMLPENQYHQLEKLNKKQVLEKLQETVEQEDN